MTKAAHQKEHKNIHIENRMICSNEQHHTNVLYSTTKITSTTHLEDWSIVALAVFKLTRRLPVARESGERLAKLHLEIHHLVCMLFEDVVEEKIKE